MKNKKIFIACSSEELELAERARELLSGTFDVTVWSESILEAGTIGWRINESTLQGLLRATLLFDFVLVIGTSDDVVKSRGIVLGQARDNVTFELGLFIGRLGLKNCALLVEKNLNVMTDLDGIVLNTFDKKDSETFKRSIAAISLTFQNCTESIVNFFPSTTLASVYFENLLFPVCRYFIENGGFELDKKKYNHCILQIIIPNRLSEDVNLQFEQMKHNLGTREVSIKVMGRIRKVNLDTTQQDDKLVFVDFPTILAGINHAIKNLMNEDFRTMSNDYQAILDRELLRFVKTLELLIRKNGFEKLIEFKWN